MAMAAALEARGGLAGGREREGRGLGLVEDGVGVLTLKGIRPRCPGRGDRWGGSVLGEEQRRAELERGGR